jgi:NitT/TauT family transport system substrate-binding protein
MREVVYGMPTEKSAPTVQFGIARGFFAEEGIRLKTRALYGGPAIAKALNEGSLDFGHLGTPPAIVAHGKGARFRLVASGVKKKAHLYLGVRPEFKNYRELHGCRLGLLSLGSCDEWIARRMLSLNGLDPDRDITFVPIAEEYDRIGELFADRRIDAALAIEPNMALGEAAGALKIWAAAYDEPYLPVFQWTVLAASDRLIKDDPQLLQALLRAYVRSSHAARDHAEEFIAFVAERFALPPSVARCSLSREMGHYELDGRMDLAGLAKAIEVQGSLNAVQRPVSPDALTDLRFLAH